MKSGWSLSNSTMSRYSSSKRVHPDSVDYATVPTRVHTIEPASQYFSKSRVQPRAQSILEYNPGPQRHLPGSSSSTPPLPADSMIRVSQNEWNQVVRSLRFLGVQNTMSHRARNARATFKGR